MQDEHCPAWKQNEAALALAQLHLDTGATLAAQQVLSILKQPGEALDGTEQQGGTAGQQAHTLFHRAGLMLRLGQQVCCCFVSCCCCCYYRRHCCSQHLDILWRQSASKAANHDAFPTVHSLMFILNVVHLVLHLETGTIKQSALKPRTMLHFPKHIPFHVHMNFVHSMLHLETGTVTSPCTKHSMQREICHPAHGFTALQYT